MLSWLFGTGSTKNKIKPMRRGAVKPYTVKVIESEWKNIKILLEGKKPSQLRQALIRADKTLDSALKDLVTGQTMGERLKNAPHMFDRSLYDKVWKAHKTRNALVHESGYEPPHHIISTSINNLKTALNSLGVKNI